MNRDEQGMIQNLFGKLADAERSAPPRDGEADRFISDSVSRQPAAPYYMAQTILIQEQALEAAQARIQALEEQANRQPQSSGGGLFGSLFGGGSRQPQQPAPQRAAYGQPQNGYNSQMAGGGQQNGPWGGGNAGSYGGQPQQAGAFGGGRAGGGFMAGAAQTAMGVAGGMVLGSMLSNAFSGDPAAAATEAVAGAGEAAETELANVQEDMGGGDFGGGEDFEDV